MVLYQKRRIPFIIRLAMVIFHPGILLLMAVPVVILYFALHEKSSMATGMFISAAVISLFTLVCCYLLIKEIISRIVLIEVVPEGLRIDMMKYDDHIDVVIPTKDIDVEIGIHRGRRSRRTSYRLFISHKGNTKLTFSLQEDSAVIGKILDGIEKQKLISLRAKEKDFLEEYRKGLTGSAKLVNLVIVVVILGVIAYNLYSNQATLRNWYNNLNALRSPVTGFWKVRSGDLIFEVDLLTDSSYNESIFGRTGRWRFVPDSAGNHFGELFFFNEDKRFAAFSLINFSDSTLTLQGKADQRQIIFSKIKTSEMASLDSGARFMACYDPAIVIPPSNATIRGTMDAMIPERKGLLPVEMLIKNDTLAVATLSGPVDGLNNYLIVLNPRSKQRLGLAALPHGVGCDATHKISYWNGRPVVVQHTVCFEAGDSEKTTQCFSLESSGKLVETSCEGLAGAD